MMGLKALMLPTDAEIEAAIERLTRWAVEIDINGTPSQAGPGTEECEVMARFIAGLRDLLAQERRLRRQAQDDAKASAKAVRAKVAEARKRAEKRWRAAVEAATRGAP